VTNQQLWTGGAVKINYQMNSWFSGSLQWRSFTAHVHESVHDLSFSGISKAPKCSVSNILEYSWSLSWQNIALVCVAYAWMRWVARSINIKVVSI